MDEQRIKTPTPEELISRYETGLAEQQMRRADLDVPNIYKVRGAEAGIMEALEFKSLDEGMRDALKRRLAFVRLYWMALDRFSLDVWEAQKACGIDCHPDSEGAIPEIPSPRKDGECDAIPF